jgi:hypothetical protein
MQFDRFLTGVKLVCGLLPVYYGGLLLATQEETLWWGLVSVVLLIVLLVLVAWLDAPLRTIWPLFPGAFLITSCSIALLASPTPHGFVPRTTSEVGLLYVLAFLYILWGVEATRNEHAHA